jgi:hypothetical protein
LQQRQPKKDIPNTAIILAPVLVSGRNLIADATLEISELILLRFLVVWKVDDEFLGKDREQRPDRRPSNSEQRPAGTERSASGSI